MGELLCPLPGAGLSGGCLPREAAGGTAPVAEPALEPWSQPPQELRSSRSAGPGGSGAGPLICSARGRSVLAVLGPPGLCLSRGRRDPGLCPGALCSGACAGGSALPPRSHLRGAAAQVPPSCSWNRAAPSARSLFFCPSPSELLPGPRSPLRGAAARAPSAAPGPAVRAAALRELGALSRGAGVC